nr:MAG TPA: hypothetical protein [Caudoviricetes sp.]
MRFPGARDGTGAFRISRNFTFPHARATLKNLCAGTMGA